MSIFPVCDEQHFFFNINEKSSNIPMRISFSMKFSKTFTVDEIRLAVEKSIRTADVFSSRCVVKDNYPYIEFSSYQKRDIPVFHFSDEEEFQTFCRRSETTDINNRDRLYYIFIYSVADSGYHLHFIFNHLIFDGVSGIVLSNQIQEVLLDSATEVKWSPFATYLENRANYISSERYGKDQEFWEDRLLEISKSDYLFNNDDILDLCEAPVKNLALETSQELKVNMYECCAKRNISPHILIATVFAQIINDKTGSRRFYFEIPVANRLGANEKNSIGAYETAFPFIFDFEKYGSILDILASVQKQSMDYYKHKNYDWISKISTKSYEREYKKYIPQFSFSYLCSNKEPVASIASLHNHHPETDTLPLSLFISDYKNWQTMMFDYTYWECYFTEEEVMEIHQNIEIKIANTIKNLN